MATSQERSVMTVLGPVSPENLGVTMMHEHVIADSTSVWLLEPRDDIERRLQEAPIDLHNLSAIRRDPLINRQNWILDDVDLAVGELSEYVQLGGATIVEVTLDEMGREPDKLATVARATGLNIVAACGHYVAHSHPSSLEDEAVSSVADRMIDEITVGIRDTGIRAGIIGEIGTTDPIHPREMKVLQAAAIAQKATGVPITVHVDLRGRRGHEILDIVEAAGASTHRVILGHQDGTLAQLDLTLDEAVEYHASLAERGCFIEYDLCGAVGFARLPDGTSIGFPSDRERALALAQLIEQGYEDQLLLSQDRCTRSGLTSYGGTGYAHVLRSFGDLLRAVGLKDLHIEKLLVENPRAALTPSI